MPPATNKLDLTPKEKQQGTTASKAESIEHVFDQLRQRQDEVIKSAPQSTTREYAHELDDFLNREYGFKSSFEKADSIDGAGNPIPWMTYSAIYYLDQLDLSQCSIFEWGSGNSTLYFSKRAKSVRSVESNADWFTHINSQKPANSELTLEQPDQYASCIAQCVDEYDVIVVDGDIFRRLECAIAALPKLKDGGIIVLDNSDWLQNTCKVLRSLGFAQIDFAGPGPINAYTWCTSVFFKDRISIPSKDFRPSYLTSGIRNVRDEQLSQEHIKNIDAPSDNFEQQYVELKANRLPEHTDVFSSQEGEDILIKRLLKWHYFKPGFYVDVGAHHPIRFSNTYHYYLQGWRGINIDPIPGTKQVFDEQRPRDVNLEVGVAEEQGELEYFQFEEPAFNTFCPAAVVHAKTKSELVQISTIQMLRLDEVLEREVSQEQQITFMTIDVEGFELSVLNSSNWQKYRPYIVCIEALSENEVADIDAFLNEANYVKVAATKNSHFYCEYEFWQQVK